MRTQSDSASLLGRLTLIAKPPRRRQPTWSLTAQLKVHHSTVERVLAHARINPARRYARASMLDPYVPFVEEIFARYPTLRASRLYQMVRDRGYPGSSNHFSLRS